MIRNLNVALAIVAALAIGSATHSSAAAASQAATASAAATAAKASPDLTAALSQELGTTPEQSAGAAGALFGAAKSQMKPNDWAQVAKAVPGMAALLKAAPTGGGKKNDPLSQLGASAGGLAAAAAGFSKLGLSPDLVAKAIPVLTSFVSKSGGANVAGLLAGALK
ncbi:MAG TPA: DUF2780 domain-containing protein [Vicinamibacterales bacterium]|nr:DUF2780 domain-containing protein [Vicinamibacterales bacterium]